MNKLRVWLGGLLGLQILLALVLYVASKGQDASFESEYLLGLNLASINKITVSSVDASIVIDKGEEGWVIPSANNLPADPVKVAATLQSLYNFKSTWPVTTSANAHERFKVAKDSFGRKVVLSQDDTADQVVYLGTSPSFRKSHVRPEGDVNVYSLDVNTFDFPDDVGGWLDKKLLSVEGVDTISGADFLLEKQNSEWKISPKGATDAIDGRVDGPKVDMVVAAFGSVEVRDIVENPPKFEGDDLVTVTVKNDTSEWTYQFFKVISSYYIKRSDIDFVFSMNKMDYQDLSRFFYKDFVIKDPKASMDETKVDSESE